MGDLTVRLLDGGERVSWSLAGTLGVVEVWYRADTGRGIRGGVELHYHPQEAERVLAGLTPCSFVSGGSCRHEGSSTAFDEQVRPYLRDAAGRVLVDSVAVATIDHTARAWAAANLEPEVTRG